MGSDSEELSSEEREHEEEEVEEKSKRNSTSKADKKEKKSKKDKKEKKSKKDKKSKKEKSNNKSSKDKESKNEKKSKKDDSEVESEEDKEQIEEPEPDSDDGFSTVSIRSSSVDFDNINSKDVELWMFSVPKDFNLSLLDGKKFKEGATISKYKIDRGDSTQISSLFNMFPFKKEEKISLGKPFTKNFEIKSVTKVEPEEFPEQAILPDKYRQPDNLKVRFFPIGSSESVGESEHHEKMNQVLEAHMKKHSKLHKPRPPIKFENWTGKTKMKDTANRFASQQVERGGWKSAPSTPLTTPAPTPVKKTNTSNKSAITKFDDEESEDITTEETPKKSKKNNSTKESKEEEENTPSLSKRRRSEGEVAPDVEKPTTKRIKKTK